MIHIVLLGINHRSAPVALRERVAFSSEQACRAAAELRSGDAWQEAVVLSTCNRSEVYAVPGVSSPARPEALESFFAHFHRLSPAELHGCLYQYRNRDAVAHLFRVSSGLDSMLLGEAEILGQVRDAYKRALEGGTTGPVLNRLFQGALEVGKRVRAETDLGRRPMSVAFAAVKLAEQIFGRLRHYQALVLGAGAVAEQVAEHLRDRGIGKMLVANRTRGHAETLAQRVAGQVVDWEGLGGALEVADVVVASVANVAAVLTRVLVEQAMAARGNRALFLIDLGVPRNVEAPVEQLYNVYLYNIDNLAEIVEQNRKARQREVPRAEAIIAEHLAKFEAWQADALVRSLLEELWEKLQSEREAFLRAHREQIRQLSAEDRQRFGELAEQLLDGLVQDPAAGLRRRAGLRLEVQQVEAVRQFFGLNQGKP